MSFSLFRRVILSSFILLIVFSSSTVYATGECYGSQQCNYYATTRICNYPSYGNYCGSWGGGCTECVDMNCNSCVVNGDSGCSIGYFVQSP
jgi:hypothetical protein